MPQNDAHLQELKQQRDEIAHKITDIEHGKMFNPAGDAGLKHLNDQFKLTNELIKDEMKRLEQNQLDKSKPESKPTPAPTPTTPAPPQAVHHESPAAGKLEHHADGHGSMAGDPGGSGKNTA